MKSLSGPRETHSSWQKQRACAYAMESKRSGLVHCELLPQRCDDSRLECNRAGCEARHEDVSAVASIACD